MTSFYNRESELTTLLALIKAFQEGKPNNAGVYNKVGKTRILFELK